MVNGVGRWSEEVAGGGDDDGGGGSQALAAAAPRSTPPPLPPFSPVQRPSPQPPTCCARADSIISARSRLWSTVIIAAVLRASAEPCRPAPAPARAPRPPCVRASIGWASKNWCPMSSTRSDWPHRGHMVSVSPNAGRRRMKRIAQPWHTYGAWPAAAAAAAAARGGVRWWVVGWGVETGPSESCIPRKRVTQSADFRRGGEGGAKVEGVEGCTLFEGRLTWIADLHAGGAAHGAGRSVSSPPCAHTCPSAPGVDACLQGRDREARGGRGRER